jgi:hypothetical protein
MNNSAIMPGTRLNSAPRVPLLRRSWYFQDLDVFQKATDDTVLAHLVRGSEFPVLQTQRDAWLSELSLLRAAAKDRKGSFGKDIS